MIAILIYATLCLIVCTGALLLLMIFAADRFGCGCNNQQLKDIMAKINELKGILDSVNDTLAKVGTEIDALKDALANVDIPPDAQASLDKLTALSKSLDDKNPDATT